MPVRCENSIVTIQSAVSKTALKEQGAESQPGHSKAGPRNQHNKTRDISKFRIYFDFTSNVQRIQPHQVGLLLYTEMCSVSTRTCID